MKWDEMWEISHVVGLIVVVGAAWCARAKSILFIIITMVTVGGLIVVLLKDVGVTWRVGGDGSLV